MDHLIARPVRIRRMASGFAIVDADGRDLAIIYYRDDPATARTAGTWTEPEAKSIAQEIARALMAATDGPERDGNARVRNVPE